MSAESLFMPAGLRTAAAEICDHEGKSPNSVKIESNQIKKKAAAALPRRRCTSGTISASRKRKLVENKISASDSEDDEVRRKDDSSKRRKRARRGQRRPHKGYYEMTARERAKMEERAKQRAEQVRERMLAKGHMLAPYNSTQFIMSDHAYDEVRQRLDRQLHDVTADAAGADENETSPPRQQPASRRRQRGRDSSFSIDSDEDYFYSSPEDEEEFISREFTKDYANGNLDRLGRMDKENLIQEYLGVEKKLELLEKRLLDINQRETMKALTGEVDYEFHRGEVPMEPDMAEKIQVFQGEIARLISENHNLHRENTSLKKKLVRSRHSSSSSSTSSSGSSSSSSEDSSTASSDEEEEEEAVDVEKILEEIPPLKADEKTDDTGYESTQSKELTPEPERKKELPEVAEEQSAGRHS